MTHLEIQHTDDGSATLFVPELDEHYHSVKGAYTESLHIYRGSAYNSGKESIPAKLRAGSKSQVLKSLYCYPLNNDTASIGTLDLKNGYANSMYAASVCFEDDAYWNTLKVDITNKSLRISSMPQTKTRPDSPVPSLQGPCDRSLKSEVPCGSCLNWR